MKLTVVTAKQPTLLYFTESKGHLKSRSDEHKRFFRNWDCEKNEIAKPFWEADHNFGWDQKEVVERENKLISRKIKKNYTLFEEPLQNFKINKINNHKIPYMLPEI